MKMEFTIPEQKIVLGRDDMELVHLVVSEEFKAIAASYLRTRFCDYCLNEFIVWDLISTLKDHKQRVTVCYNCFVPAYSVCQGV